MSFKVKSIEVEVSNTPREWQLYSADDDCGITQSLLDTAARELNAAAAEALATRSHEKAWAVFAKAQKKWMAVGAWDTEPSWEFEKLLTAILGPNDDER